MDSDWISPFWQAFAMPPRSRVCGMRLPPLSVWHVFALEYLRNTYIIGGIVDAGEARELMTVAGMSRRRFLRAFHQRGGMTRALRRARRRMLRNAMRRGADPVMQCMAYVEQSMRVPGRWLKDGGKPCVVPHSLHVLAAAVRTGVALDAAWDMPYAQARCMFDIHAEGRGDESMQTAAAQEMDERMSVEKEAARG
jgi:hypothetical protein